MGNIKKSSPLFLTFFKASALMKELGVTTFTEYEKLDHKELHLPPYVEYYTRDLEWIGKNSFFGYLIVDHGTAKEIISKMNIREPSEYQKLDLKNLNLPTNPNKMYARSGWVSWDDYLGLRIKSVRPPGKCTITYEESKKIARDYVFASKKDFLMWFLKLEHVIFGIPKNPEKHFKGRGWVSWDDYLGILNYLPYSKASKLMINLNIQSLHQYCHLDHQNLNLPENPYYYEKYLEWGGIEDFFNGRFTVSEDLSDHAGSDSSKHKSISNKKRRFVSYERAKEILRGLNIVCNVDYGKLNLKNFKLPKYPEKTYEKHGWISFEDFYGNKNYRRKNYTQDGKYRGLDFTNARNTVRQLKIKSSIEYYKYIKENKECGLPSSPRGVYLKYGWLGWGDFLGTFTKCRRKIITSNVYRRKDMTYTEACELIRKFKLKNSVSYMKWYSNVENKKLGLPSLPHVFFRSKGWISWPDFLAALPSRSDISRDEFIGVVLGLDTNTWREYLRVRKGFPKLNLPSNPYKFDDKNEFIFSDFLRYNKRRFASESEFVGIVLGLNIRCRADYNVIRGVFPELRLPRNPYKYYKDGDFNFKEYVEYFRKIDHRKKNRY